MPAENVSAATTPATPRTEATSAERPDVDRRPVPPSSARRVPMPRRSGHDAVSGPTMVPPVAGASRRESTARPRRPDAQAAHQRAHDHHRSRQTRAGRRRRPASVPRATPIRSGTTATPRSPQRARPRRPPRAAAAGAAATANLACAGLRPNELITSRPSKLAEQNLDTARPRSRTLAPAAAAANIINARASKPTRFR